MTVELERYNKRIKFVVFLIIALAIGGAVFYHIVERWSYLDSLYFTVSTLTTVGYGDFTPKTNFGKVFTIANMVIGVGIVLYGLSMIAAHFIEQREEEFIEVLGGTKVKRPAKNILDKFKNFIRFENETIRKTGRNRGK